jgi:hypothetical protein
MKINEERKFEQTKNFRNYHQTTFQKSLKGKIQYQETSNHHYRPINIRKVKTFSSKEGQISQQCSPNKATINKHDLTSVSTIEVRKQ